MPSKSPAQARLMAACSHGANYDSCPPKKVAKEFNQADKGGKMLKKTTSFKEWVERPVDVSVRPDVSGDITKIAKKHGVSEDEIRSQLNVGIGVEHEHTKKKGLATKIALDHLLEKPDYYTALDKMEKGECDK